MAKPLPVAAVVFPRESRASSHVLAQVGHLRDTARVVGDGAVGVCGKGDPKGGEHAHRGQADAVEPHVKVGAAARRIEADQHGHAYDEHREHAGIHSQGDSADNHGARARHGGVRQLLGGTVGVRGEILGGVADQDTGHQPGEHRGVYAGVARA